ncbi:hypothetical protein GQ607_012584 [Colletotrichum asianum]|uniref:Uncharacterized protein n=1 Tax=Colletotrichum asianum TaxID=702518 RepID=A0A8H3W8L4_9PEZI|nr:hypothetical protein GQ607_012584 [Colletotrichum asianum]
MARSVQSENSSDRDINNVRSTPRQRPCRLRTRLLRSLFPLVASDSLVHWVGDPSLWVSAHSGLGLVAVVGCGMLLLEWPPTRRQTRHFPALRPRWANSYRDDKSDGWASVHTDRSLGHLVRGPELSFPWRRPADSKPSSSREG